MSKKQDGDYKLGGSCKDSWFGLLVAAAWIFDR